MTLISCSSAAEIHRTGFILGHSLALEASEREGGFRRLVASDLVENRLT